MIYRVSKKFGLILSRHQKIRVIEIVLLMVLGGILETCSVSLVLPFMDIITNPDNVMKRWYVIIVSDIFGIHSAKSFIIFIALILAALYIIKNLYLMLEYNIQYRFVYKNMFLLQQNLLDNFIHRPYEYFLKVNSGEIIRIVNHDTLNAFSLLSTLLMLFTEMIVSLMLVTTVFFIAPLATLVIVVILLILLLVIMVLLKPILRKAGLTQQQSAAGMNKWLLQSVQGIKEIKTANKEKFFQDNFDWHGQRYVTAVRQNNIYSIMPKFIIEAVCMGAMFVTAAVLVNRGAELDAIIPMISAVAMAALRLLPSVNRISTSLSAISYNEPMLDRLIENLKNVSSNGQISLEAADGVVPRLSREIKFESVTYFYPDNPNAVLLNAGMKIKRGESVGIAGPSGAGKTTTVDIILGLLRPKEGQICVDGVDIKKNMHSWTKQIGYIPQTIFMLDDSIKANIAFGEDVIDEGEIWRALNEASLDDFVRNLPDGLNTQIGERGIRLSGGQRQRIGIARALYKNPEILIFDEATSALDNETENDIMESIHALQGQKTMIIIAHRLTTIESCDHIYRVEDGTITKTR